MGVILMGNVESSGNMISKLPASKAVRLASPSYTRTRSRGNPRCKQRIVFNNCLPQRRYIQPPKTHGSRKFSNSVEWMHRDAGPKVKARVAFRRAGGIAKKQIRCCHEWLTPFNRTPLSGNGLWRRRACASHHVFKHGPVQPTGHGTRL